MDNPTILYRIQDKEGNGPFADDFLSRWADRGLKNGYQDFPCFWEKIKDRHDYFGYACRTPEKLRCWFTEEEYEGLKSLNYKAVKLVAHEIVEESDAQVLMGRRIPFKDKTISFNLY